MYAAHRQVVVAKQGFKAHPHTLQYARGSSQGTERLQEPMARRHGDLFEFLKQGEAQWSVVRRNGALI
jgi:hypothetical protein